MKAGLTYIALFALLLLSIPLLALLLKPTVAQESAPAVQEPSAQPSAARPSQPDEPASRDTPEKNGAGDESGTAAPEEAAVPAAGDARIMEELEKADESAAALAERQSGGDNAGQAESFRVYDQTTGLVNEIALIDFLYGSVASEMPASFHTEAMKAQAIASHTFALHNRDVQWADPDPTLSGADFAADPTNMKVYITEQTARDFYGEKYADEYWNKITAAVDSVAGLVLEYEGEPIVAAYHAISAGRTEAAENVWSGSADYLVPALSEGDLLAPAYEVTESFSADEVEAALLSAFPGLVLPDDPAGWFQAEERSESGYITKINVGDTHMHGKDIRTLFDLRSHNMDIAYSDGVFDFTTYGYGHGVGLSQYGADFLARQGYSYEEILAHYYPGTELVNG